jgi:hypothetical protein
MNTKFQNQSLQALYDKLNSYEGFQLRGIKEIHDTIYPLLEEVIHNPECYAEAVFYWPLFQSVIDVVENGNKEFTMLTDTESMCYSLWWHTDHTHFESCEFDPELSKIFKGSTHLTMLNNFVSSYNGLNVVHI